MNYLLVIIGIIITTGCCLFTTVSIAETFIPENATLATLTKPPAPNSQSAEEMKAISWEELYNLISGNTLITWNKMFCSDQMTKKECPIVAVLEPSKSKKIAMGRNGAIVILPDSHEMRQKDWGYYSMPDGIYMGLHFGMGWVSTQYQAYPNGFDFKNLIQINSKKDMFRLTFPDSVRVIYIQQGQNKQMINQAIEDDYKFTDKRGQISPAQFVLGSTVIAVAKGAMAAYAAKSNSSSSYCESGDTCFQVIKYEDGNNYGDTFIRCIKGPKTGEEKCISYKKSTGKYAYGCFNAVGHYHTLEQAGNFVCE